MALKVVTSDDTGSSVTTQVNMAGIIFGTGTEKRIKMAQQFTKQKILRETTSRMLGDLEAQITGNLDSVPDEHNNEILKIPKWIKTGKHPTAAAISIHKEGVKRRMNIPQNPVS